MNHKRVYNALATFGQISVGLHGLSFLAFAVVLLIMGGMFLGSSYDLVPAIVDSVDLSSVGVTYKYNGNVYAGSFDAYNAYTPGDMIFIRVNPASPTSISEDLPWKSFGLGMMSAAIAIGYLAWYAIHLVSDDRNMAALAGSLTAIGVIV
jgi:hypothetical protein